MSTSPEIFLWFVYIFMFACTNIFEHVHYHNIYNVFYLFDYIQWQYLRNLLDVHNPLIDKFKPVVLGWKKKMVLRGVTKFILQSHNSWHHQFYIRAVERLLGFEKLYRGSSLMVLVSECMLSGMHSTTPWKSTTAQGGNVAAMLRSDQLEDHRKTPGFSRISWSKQWLVMGFARHPLIFRNWF